MLSWLRRLVGRKPLLVIGAGKLPEGQSKRIAVGDPFADGKELILARVGGKLCAVDRKCPHEAAGRISDGPLHEGRYVMCPLHNYKFDAATGRAEAGACKNAKLYRVREIDGNAEIDV